MVEAASPNRISSSSELDEFLDRSQNGPVWLFKHSLICATSSRAYGEFLDFAAGLTDRDDAAVIEIQRARDISMEAAERTRVRHQSPQVILLRDGQAIWSASHWDITEEALARAAQEYGELAHADGA